MSRWIILAGEMEWEEAKVRMRDTVAEWPFWQAVTKRVWTTGRVEIMRLWGTVWVEAAMGATVGVERRVERVWVSPSVATVRRRAIVSSRSAESVLEGREGLDAIVFVVEEGNCRDRGWSAHSDCCSV